MSNWRYRLFSRFRWLAPLGSKAYDEWLAEFEQRLQKRKLAERESYEAELRGY